MDAYVFGNHSGELPTDLVSTEGSSRIRAVARLEGGEHDIFYALETESREDVDRHLSAIEGAGTNVVVVFHPHGDRVELGPIPLPIPPPPPTPAWIPPCAWVVFVLAAVEDIVLLIEGLRERFGVEFVAGIRVGERYLLEVGAERRDALAAALDELGPLAGVSNGVAHFASSVYRG